MALQVDLADLYNGKVKKLAINRKVPVNPDEKPKACDACDTRGVRMMTRQIGPGMIQQMQVACDACGGMGYQVKMKQERQILECSIEKVVLAAIINVNVCLITFFDACSGYEAWAEGRPAR